MTRLIHAGSAVVDYVYRIDALPKPGGEKTASRWFKRNKKDCHFGKFK